MHWYDAEGNLLYGNHPLYGDGLLRMTYDDGLLDFGIERNDYRTLRITLGESLRDEPWETRILVGNDYESEEEVKEEEKAAAGQFIWYFGALVVFLLVCYLLFGYRR